MTLRRINVSGYTVQDQLPKHLLAVADGVVIVYSVDDERSFQVWPLNILFALV